jgi:hypothetical protein
LPSFFNPAFQPDLLDSAEMVDFHVMRIHCSTISRRRQKGAWEIIAVTAQLHAPGLYTIQRCTPLWWEVVMLPILLAATPAGDILLRECFENSWVVGYTCLYGQATEKNLPD